MIKPIPNFDGYFIDDSGTVWCNLCRGARSNRRSDTMHKVNGRPARNGYLRVYIRDMSTNKRMDKYIHRLVAEAFIPNPERKKYVNHKDCNRQNNCVDNLEWCTVEENTAQTERLGHIIRDQYGRFVGNFDYRKLLSI